MTYLRSEAQYNVAYYMSCLQYIIKTSSRLTMISRRRGSERQPTDMTLELRSQKNITTPDLQAGRLKLSAHPAIHSYAKVKTVLHVLCTTLLSCS